jgi:hypothetical protein
MHGTKRLALKLDSVEHERMTSLHDPQERSDGAS